VPSIEAEERLPVFNLDSTVPSSDPDTLLTDNITSSTPQAASFLSIPEEHTTGQTNFRTLTETHSAMSFGQESSSASRSRDSTPHRMSSDAALAPPSFKGTTSEDAERWLRRFKYYVDYRKMSEDEALQIFKLFMADTAADWLESLDDNDKRSFRAITDKFIERFESSEVFRWQKASEIFSRQQGPTEKVDTFITDILNLAKRVPIDDPTIIRYALLKGFKPSIRQHVLQTSPETLDATLKSARIANMAAGNPDTRLKFSQNPVHLQNHVLKLLSFIFSCGFQQ